MMKHAANRSKNTQTAQQEDGRGRPIFDGKNEKDVLSKLESAYIIGHSDKEACLIAGISQSALYRYQKKNPAFTERKLVLKASPMLKARRAIFKELNNPQFALQYMKARHPEEFGGPSSLRAGIRRQEQPWTPSPVSERVQELIKKYAQPA